MSNFGLLDRKHWSRLIAVMNASQLVGCTTDLSEYVPPSAPSPASALEGARQAAETAKLTGLVERSRVREAYPLGPGRYVLCLQGATAGSDVRRTYAVFFDNDKYKAVRTSVMIDGCEKQAFSPMPPAKAVEVDSSAEVNASAHANDRKRRSKL
jgi:hypothetical protein